MNSPHLKAGMSSTEVAVEVLVPTVLAVLATHFPLGRKITGILPPNLSPGLSTSTMTSRLFIAIRFVLTRHLANSKINSDYYINQLKHVSRDHTINRWRDKSDWVLVSFSLLSTP